MDSIRGVGIVIVLLAHFWPHSLSRWIYQIGQLGWIAMDAFFVLSGFLITGILADSRARPDYFSRYYLRRAFRIFPLYYAVLTAIVLVTCATRVPGGTAYTAMITHWGHPAWFFFYLGNIRDAYVGAFPALFAFGPLWSLQIEEQFYLLFPFAVRWMRLEHLSKLLWLLVAASPMCRVFFFLRNPHNALAQYVLLPCHMEGLALGAIIAIRFRSGPWKLPKLPLVLATIAAFGLTVAGAVFSTPFRTHLDWATPFNRLAGYSLSSFACALLLLSLIRFRGSPYTWILRTAPVRYLATISYGVYLLHPLASLLLRSVLHGRLAPASFARFVAVIATTLLLASISWFAFERPLLQWKDRFAPRPAGDPQAGLAVQP